jgi:hypothetical protein
MHRITREDPTRFASLLSTKGSLGHGGDVIQEDTIMKDGVAEKGTAESLSPKDLYPSTEFEITFTV